MSILTWIGQALGLIPQAIEAGKQVAAAVKPQNTINPDDATLWHTLDYQTRYLGAVLCTVCQKRIADGHGADLCSEAVRRRNAGLS